MDLITYALAKKHGGESITYTLTADTENKTIVLTPSEGTAQVITVPYATDASTVNGHEVPELENGKIPANFLPSFVDNVDEYDNISLFPVIGESNRIYIDKSTNKTYRWSGTAYVEISESIALGETSSTAYRGDRGKIAYDHSQSAHAPSNAEANQNAFSNVKIDSDIINASTTTDTLEFIAGDNIILTPNVSNKKITVSQAPVRKTASGNIASFSDGTGDPFLEVKVNIVPVQSGSGDPSPSNVRPISGWSGANVTRCGNNLLDPNIAGTDGYYDDNGEYHTSQQTGYYGPIPIGASMQYSAKLYAPNWTAQGGLDAIFAVYFFDKNNNWISREKIAIGQTATDGYTNTLTFTTPATCSKIYLQAPKGNAASTQLDLSKSVVTLGNVATYEPYQGSTLSIPFHDNSDNPITVYGGRLNVTSGELTVTHAKKVLNDTEKWSMPSQAAQGYSCYRYFSNEAKQRTSVICDRLKNRVSTNYSIPSNVLTVYDSSGSAAQWIVSISNDLADSQGQTSTDAFLAWLAQNNLEVVYELATPQTYQLTPAQVTTLLGQNNIFADCGQIEVAYKTPFYSDLTTKNEVQVLINESITSALNASY